MTDRAWDDPAAKEVPEMGWYTTTKQGQQGPFTDHQVIEMIAKGELRSYSALLAEGATTWITVKDYPPFASELAPAAPVDPGFGNRPITFWQGCLTVVGIFVVAGIVVVALASTKGHPPPPPVTSPAPLPQPQPPPPSPWVSIAHPRDPNHLAQRLRYMQDVVTRLHGEPAMVPAAAQSLLEKVASELADAAGVPPGTVTAKVGTESGSLQVKKGARARVKGKNGAVLRPGICSEAYLAPALMAAEVGMKENAANLGGFVCTSDDCMAIFDLRPTRPDGGGLYIGEGCLSFADLMAASLQQ